MGLHKKRNKSCAVKYCNNKSCNTVGISYFTMPKDIERRSVWIKQCYIYNGTNALIQNLRICGEHFEAKMFDNVEKKKLSIDAVPTLFSDEILAKRKSDNNIIVSELHQLATPVVCLSLTPSTNTSANLPMSNAHTSKLIDQWASNINEYAWPKSNFHPSTYMCDLDLERASKQIKNIWATWKQSTVFTDTLKSYFVTSRNPYLLFLKLISVLSKYRIKGKNDSMNNTIIEEFHRWIKKHESEYNHVLTDELKTQAFQLILEKKMTSNTTKTFVNIFNCNSSLNLMEKLIRDASKQKRFKEACYLSMSLNIQDRFTVEEFLLPLFFSNMISVTDEFLSTSKFQQEALVKYFDNMLAKTDDYLYQLANGMDIKITNFSNKSQIQSNLSRIMKKYNISNIMASNITKQKKKRALMYMLHLYKSGVIGINGWREMALDLIRNDEGMMLVLVRICYGDIQEAVYFAQLFSIDPSLLPHEIKQELLHGEKSNVGLENSLPIKEYQTEQYYELSLPKKQIHVIDCAPKFNEFLDKINDKLIDGHLDVLSLDCEWKPELMGDKSDLASIQLATIDAIYIFHIPQLQPTQHYKNHWHIFSMKIFSNVNILKLGFDWKGNATMIKSSLPFDNVQLHGPRFVDMKLLWKKLETMWNFQLPYQSPNDEIAYNSLSDLVKLCFGKPLNKTEQFSNWENVPLRLSQIKYAALDAYCLLEIYNIFKSKCKASHIPFEEVCHQISNNDHPETMKPKAKTKRNRNVLNYK